MALRAMCKYSTLHPPLLERAQLSGNLIGIGRR